MALLTGGGYRRASRRPRSARQRRALALALDWLMAPALYSLLVPLVLVDVWITAYQFICLPLCGMPAVRRHDYFTLDRHRLAYLNALQKVNCTYCTYANGLFAYAREVAARTEAYWCPIRHGQPIPHAHTYYAGFSAFGDAAAFRRRRSRGLLLARPHRRPH